MTEKVIKPPFTDNRTAEFIRRVKDVIDEYAVKEQMTYCDVIGALECIKLDLYTDEDL